MYVGEILRRFSATLLFILSPILYVIAYLELAEGDYKWALYDMVFAGFGWFFATHLWEWSKQV